MSRSDDNNANATSTNTASIKNQPTLKTNWVTKSGRKSG